MQYFYLFTMPDDKRKRPEQGTQDAKRNTAEFRVELKKKIADYIANNLRSDAMFVFEERENSLADVKAALGAFFDKMVQDAGFAGDVSFDLTGEKQRANEIINEVHTEFLRRQRGKAGDPQANPRAEQEDRVRQQKDADLAFGYWFQDSFKENSPYNIRKRTVKGLRQGKEINAVLTEIVRETQKAHPKISEERIRSTVTRWVFDAQREHEVAEARLRWGRFMTWMGDYTKEGTKGGFRERAFMQFEKGRTIEEAVRLATEAIFDMNAYLKPEDYDDVRDQVWDYMREAKVAYDRERATKDRAGKKHEVRAEREGNMNEWLGKIGDYAYEEFRNGALYASVLRAVDGKVDSLPPNEQGAYRAKAEKKVEKAYARCRDEKKSAYDAWSRTWLSGLPARVGKELNKGRAEAEMRREIVDELTENLDNFVLDDEAHPAERARMQAVIDAAIDKWKQENSGGAKKAAGEFALKRAAMRVREGPIRCLIHGRQIGGTTNFHALCAKGFSMILTRMTL
jgi:hypothetical protein